VCIFSIWLIIDGVVLKVNCRIFWTTVYIYVVTLQWWTEDEQAQEELSWSNGHCEQIWSWCNQV